MSTRVFVEGGGDSTKGGKDLDISCREAFRKYVQKVEVKKLPRIVACGSRNSTFNRFNDEFSKAKEGEQVLLWVDSEDPVEDAVTPWNHLQMRDRWERPTAAKDDHVLMMATCMETWVLADRSAMKEHWGSSLQESALLPQIDLEKRDRESVIGSLEKASRSSENSFKKGSRAFAVFARVEPKEVEKHCSHAKRCHQILKQSCR